ncbi:uncharacterized protein [Halyomorpha halys]|uniref:uncharacterized protein isoform X1 n=1 Tax=Halyomorpha halys TaxID=286706 RepID=UPI0034D17ED8
MQKSLVLRVAQAMKPHIPLIKFRKGQPVVNTTAKPPVSQGTPASVEGQQYYIISEEQLPLRFRRQLLDERQINVINSGGCE